MLLKLYFKMHLDKKYLVFFTFFEWILKYKTTFCWQHTCIFTMWKNNCSHHKLNQSHWSLGCFSWQNSRNKAETGKVESLVLAPHHPLTPRPRRAGLQKIRFTLEWLLLPYLARFLRPEFQVFIILSWEKGGVEARVGGGVTDGGSWEWTAVLKWKSLTVRGGYLPVFSFPSFPPSQPHIIAKCDDPSPFNTLPRTHTWSLTYYEKLTLGRMYWQLAGMEQGSEKSPLERGSSRTEYQ